ncbi:hypothetical protein BKA67DRAFT_246667 [Truncatella angustata]|uniref:Secreted protein n=1 Tax=Truncatella angustata TaxID=152316 RepID=A0A9P8UP09_9PEZI|nr:uncharacterized protein BKA67DRAFT_246667 [Truncatella angustata]KAH6655712.1 hypothetical protein BKA67DRAFT_246667 [Truncatella angustata]
MGSPRVLNILSQLLIIPWCITTYCHCICRALTTTIPAYAKQLWCEVVPPWRNRVAPIKPLHPLSVDNYSSPGIILSSQTRHHRPCQMCFHHFCVIFGT